MHRPKRSLRRDLALAYANAAVWAVGNGLVSTTLVIYLALELGAPGAAIGAVLAAPRFAGVLRLVAPVLQLRLRRRKALCIALLSASALVLVAMPRLAAPGFWLGAGEPEASQPGITVLVACWCLYHVLEYAGVVLLWSWFGDLMRPPVRGRLIGRREVCLIAGRIAGAVASFSLVLLWDRLAPESERWQPLAWSATIGAALLFCSNLPLLWIAPRRRARAAEPAPWPAMKRALASRPYRRLMAYSVGVSLASGVTTSAQSLYAQRLLNVGYETMLLLRSIMWTGQAAIAPLAGARLDRHGARAMLVVAQLVVATGPLFYWMATPDRWWWIAGAFVVWSAYAATNVALDDLKLTLAPTTPGAPARSPALAVYYVASDLAAGVMALFGGAAYDWLTAQGASALRLYAALFLLGWLARTAVAILAACIVERRPTETA